MSAWHEMSISDLKARIEKLEEESRKLRRDLRHSLVIIARLIGVNEDGVRELLEQIS